MSEEVYEQLANALDRLPNGFPRTPSNVEIPLLRKIFSPEQAWLAAQLSGTMEPVESIAERVGMTPAEARKELMKLARRGMVWFERGEGTARFRLAPFVVGVYEAQAELMDHELAHLTEQYFADGGAAGIMRPEPAIHRVLPAHSALGQETILPYDDVKAILLEAKSYDVTDCMCRVQQDALGKRRCDLPVKVCLSFSSRERSPRASSLTQEEALAVLDETERVGLVHTVSNVMEGLGYVCNCCGCCCGILRGITEFGVENSVAHANYYAVIDPDECVGCGTCIDRCHVSAIYEEDGVSVVDLEKCIGCGLCVTGCPDEVAKLVRKPEEEMIRPPRDYETWEKERLINRGLA